MANEDLLTVDELAMHLKVPKSWVYSRTRRTDSEAIPRIKIGKYIRFQMDEVMTWLENQQDMRK